MEEEEEINPVPELFVMGKVPFTRQQIVSILSERMKFLTGFEVRATKFEWLKDGGVIVTVESVKKPEDFDEDIRNMISGFMRPNYGIGSFLRTFFSGYIGGTVPADYAYNVIMNAYPKISPIEINRYVSDARQMGELAVRLDHTKKFFIVKTK